MHRLLKSAAVLIAAAWVSVAPAFALDSTVSPFAEKTVPGVVADPFTETPIGFSSASPQTIVAGATGKVMRLWRLILTCASTTNITISDGATTFLGPMPCGSIALDVDSYPWMTSATGNGLVITSSNAVQVGGLASVTQQ